MLCISCYRAYESGLGIADQVRNEGLDGWLSSSLVLEDSSLDSRWRGVFAHHQAQAVGKARRPFMMFFLQASRLQARCCRPGHVSQRSKG